MNTLVGTVTNIFDKWDRNRNYIFEYIAFIFGHTDKNFLPNIKTEMWVLKTVKQFQYICIHIHKHCLLKEKMNSMKVKIHQKILKRVFDFFYPTLLKLYVSGKYQYRSLAYISLLINMRSIFENTMLIVFLFGDLKIRV